MAVASGLTMVCLADGVRVGDGRCKSAVRLHDERGLSLPESLPWHCLVAVEDTSSDNGQRPRGMGRPWGMGHGAVRREEPTGSGVGGSCLRCSAQVGECPEVPDHCAVQGQRGQSPRSAAVWPGEACAVLCHQGIDRRVSMGLCAVTPFLRGCRMVFFWMTKGLISDLRP